MSPLGKDKKVEVSFTNWVLGGSLLSISSTDSNRRKRTVSRKVTVTEVDSNDNEIVHGKPEKKNNSGKEKEKGEKTDDKVKDKKDGEKGNQKVRKCNDDKCEKCSKGEKESSDNKKDEPKKDESKKDDSKKDESKKDDSKKDEKNSDDGDKPQKAEVSGANREGGDKSQKAEMSGANGEGGGTTWTVEQDKKIKEMKAANRSWKDIAAEVGASKKDVTNRFKELSKEGNGDSSGEKKSEEKKDEVKSNFNNGSGGGNDGDPDFSNLFDDFGGGDQASGETTNNQNNDSDSFWNRSAGANDSSNNQENGSNSTRNQSAGDKSNDFKSYSNGGGKAPEKQSWSPVNNSYGVEKQTWNESFDQGPKGKLRSNDVWSRDDCEVLEYLHKQYEEHKWHHIQAGFFNWTGRMIVAEIIEQKFLEDGAA